MENKASSPVIVLIILMLVFLISTGAGFYLYQQEHVKNIALEEKIDELTTREKISEAKLLETQKVVASLEAKVKESGDQINSLTDELNKEKALRDDAQSNLERIKSELAEQAGLRLDLEQKLNKAQSEAKVMQAKFDALQSEKNALELKAKDLEAKAQKVDLGKIVVSPEGSLAKTKAGKEIVAKEQKKMNPVQEKKVVEGKVLVVNKEYNFVVIGLGSKDGVSLGQVFSVYRGSNFIADVKVEKLHDSMSAAGFISEEAKGQIREGDTAVKKD